MGLLAGKRGRQRKVRAPEHVKPFIKQAIENLGFKARYAEIQKEALRLYQGHVSGEIENFYGIFKVKDLFSVREIAEDKGIYYGVEDDQETY